MPFLQNSLFLKTQVGNVYANALIGAEAPVSSLPSSHWKTSLWLKGVLVGVAVTESALTAVKQYQRSLFLWDFWKNPLFFCFLCLARRNLIMIEAGIPGNAWERGVCTQLCLGAR